jgi:hypothetical protein
MSFPRPRARTHTHSTHLRVVSGKIHRTGDGDEDTAENEREASHLDRGVCDTREKERARGWCGRRGGLAMGDR